MNLLSRFAGFVVVLLICNDSHSLLAVEEQEAMVIAQFRQFERDIPSLYLINGLYLSEEQVTKLVSLQDQCLEMKRGFVNDAQKLIDRYYGEVESALGKGLPASGKPVKGQRVNAKLLQGRREWMQLQTRNDKTLDDLAAQMYGALTSAQLDIIARFTPCFVPPQDFRNPERVGQASENRAQGEQILTRLRQSPSDKLTQAQEKALDHMVPYIMKENRQELTQDEITQLRAQVKTTLEQTASKIRAMNDADFELQKTDLVNELLSQHVRHNTRDEKDYAIRTIQHYLLNPGNRTILSERCKQKGGPQNDQSLEITAQEEALRDKGKEIKAAALLAELRLSQEQVRQLLPVVRQAVSERGPVETESVQIMNASLEAYAKLKNELASQNLSPQSESAANQYHGKVKMLFEIKLTDALMKYENQMDGILSADQVALLTKDKTASGNGQPPQKNMAELRRQASVFMDSVRGMNAEAYERQKGTLYKDFISQCAAAGVLDEGDIDEESESSRIIPVLDRLHLMSSADYQKTREDMVAQLCPRRCAPRSVKYGWKQNQGEPLEVLNPTTSQLLDKSTLRWLERLTSGAAIEKPN